MKRFLYPVIAASALCAFNSAYAESGKYTVKATAPQMPEGAVVYMMNYDTEEKMDSVKVNDGVAIFQGEIEKPVMVRLTGNGNRMGTFILEPEMIEVVDGIVNGGRLNGVFDDYEAKVENLQNQYQQTEDEAEKMAILQQYEDLTTKLMEDNINNPVGYYMFLQQAYDMSHDEINQMLERYPNLKQYARVQKVLNFFDAQDKTMPGLPYTDFTVNNAQGVQKLSDYVGKSKFLLVDMWASWCGPCRRESAVIKDLYNKYHDKGLDVLGVAVWEENPQNSEEAIKQLELPWPQILDAQSIPTDIYGVLGIPFIMIIDQEGNIVTRELMGEDLINAVDSLMQ